MIVAVLFFMFCSLLNYGYGQTACSTQDDIQLNTAGLFSFDAGRVEICDCSNSTCFWATVSTGYATQQWSWKNALVACRQSGYTNVMNPILQNTVPSEYHASDSVSIYQSLFQCDGTESTLTDCMTSSLPATSSTHANDAYIKCQTTSFIGDVRLIGTTVDTTGVVEYYDGSSWLTICPTKWDDVVAVIVCRSLGFEGGIRTTYANSFRGNEIDTQTSDTRIECGGDEISLSSCSFVVDIGCGTTTLAGVFCSESRLPIGSVRLFQFTSDTNQFSRVEVLYVGRWGTVCGLQSWSLSDGQVACRELGSNVDNTVIPDSVVFSSTSSRPIWVSGYNCVGDETTLESCSKENPVGYAPFCTHNTDAGLMCGNSDSSSSGLSSVAIAGIGFSVCFWFCCCCALVGVFVGKRRSS